MGTDMCDTGEVFVDVADYTVAEDDPTTTAPDTPVTVDVTEK